MVAPLLHTLFPYTTLFRSLNGKKALVTAGPTYEAIDPVRFIGNHSSGKMGFAIAEELADQGAEVTLVCGPTSLFTSRSEEHTSELQSRLQLVCRLLLEKKN